MKPTRIWIILILGLSLALVIAQAASAQPPVPHVKDDVSYKDCVSCHRTGQQDAPLMPADHAYYENSDCRTCHPPPPSILHPIAGWEDCRGCHERWKGVDVVYPGEIDIPNLADSDHDHTTYESDTCLSCHRSYAKSPVFCGVCHPESTAAETVHNGPDRWVDCVDCHQGASS